MACPATMLAKRRTESETRRKTSLTAWMTKMNCRSTGGAPVGIQPLTYLRTPYLRMPA